MSRMFSSLFVALPLALVAVSVGCDSTVVGGGGEDGDDIIGCGAALTGTARHANCDPIEDGVEEDGEDGEDGTETPPDRLSIVIERDGLALLQFASFGLSCEEESPSLPDCRASEDFLLEVEMPASYLVPGVVQFSDPAVFMFTQVRGAAEDDGQCYAGGGGSGFGSMTIHAVGDGSVRVTVDDAIMTMDSTDASRDFEVLRCTGGTPPSSFALGYLLGAGDGGDDGGDSSAQAGGEPATDRFVLQIANHDQATCVDPYQTPACPFEAKSVSVSVPRSLLEVGATLDLSNPEIFVYFSEQGTQEGTEECWFGGGGGGSEPGTLSVLSSGQGTLDVAFAGTAYDVLEGAHVVSLCD